MLSLLEMVVNGVSTRKVARSTKGLCGREFKRSTVSELAKRLDAQVEAWSERPLEGVFPFFDRRRDADQGVPGRVLFLLSGRTDLRPCEGAGVPRPSNVELEGGCARWPRDFAGRRP